jgi:hypothetical protein
MVPIGDDRLAFERHHGLPRHRDLALDDYAGALCLLVEVALIVEREEEIVVPLLVHPRGRVRARGACIDNRRKLIEIELDRLGDIFGLRAGRRDRHGNQLADETQLAVRQGMLHRHLVARHRAWRDDRLHAGKVGGDEHRRLEACHFGHAAQHGMRDRAAQERDLALAGQNHVGDIVAAPPQEAGILLARHARADALTCHRLLSSPATAPSAHGRAHHAAAP